MCYINSVMHRITIRRTLSIGDYESLSIEATGEHADINRARLLASQQILNLAQAEMARIFNVRLQNVRNSPWDQVLIELNQVNAEIGSNQ